MAFDSMGCKPGQTLIDWGCGNGPPAAKLAAKGLRVIGLDIADNCLDADVHIPLVVAPMWSPPDDLRADYAFSTDALEHVPEDMIGRTLDVIRERTSIAAFFQIYTMVDVSGDNMDPPVRLHLTIRDGDWWEKEIRSRWSDVTRMVGINHYGFVDPDYPRVEFVCR
jgi:methyltransferase family protein